MDNMPVIYEQSKNNALETPLWLVEKCISLIPYLPIDTVLDCCAGKNKIWYDNLMCQKDWCEILEGKDFLEYHNEVDWIVGNLPFNKFKVFFEKMLQIEPRKGFAFICLQNSITTSRIRRLNEKGYFVQVCKLLRVKEWKFGFNTIFLVIGRDRNNSLGLLEK
jgi:hypothetical protein